jgi:hypothetical protein
MVYNYLFPFCYLEHLDSLRLGHVKWLMSWIRLYACVLQWLLSPIHSMEHSPWEVSSHLQGEAASWKCRIKCFLSILWFILRDTCIGFCPNTLKFWEIKNSKKPQAWMCRVASVSSYDITPKLWRCSSKALDLLPRSFWFESRCQKFFYIFKFFS